MRHLRILATCIWSLFLLACELRQALQINPDGSGIYEIGVLVDKGMTETIPDIRHKAESRGFRIVETYKTPKGTFLLLRKSFARVVDLNDEQSTFRLDVEQKGLFRRDYRLTVALAPLHGVERQFVIVMPGHVIRSTGGIVAGSRVQWRCHEGGTISVIATGFALSPPAWLTIAAVLGAAAAVPWFIVVRARRRGSA